MHTQGAFKTL